MRIHRELPLQVAPFPGRIGFPAHSLTFVVKGAFRLSPDQISELLPDEEAGFPNGDVPLKDDDEDHTEIRYPSDFAFYKPRADVALAGTCHPASDQPVSSCRVTVQVGATSRSLLVTGDRWWGPDGMTDPVPFQTMPLTWDRAFGGRDCPDNPVGCGDQPIEDGNGRRVWPLPNIEYPQQAVRSTSDRPSPAGLAPIPAAWEPRRSRVGSYTRGWKEARWPWFPDDFDWAYFNSGSPSLNIDGFLNGDEDVYLEHLHPANPHFRTRLPGLRVRCFVHRLPADVDPPPSTEKARREWSEPSDDQMVFDEVPMALDTLWVDPDAGLAVLAWRGYVAARSDEFAEILDLYLRTEPLNEAPASLDVCRTAFLGLRDSDDDALEPETGDDASVEAGTAPDESAEPEPGPDQEPADEDPHGSMARLREQLEAMGVDPDEPSEPSEAELEATKEFYRKQGMDDVADFLDHDAPPEPSEEEPAPPPPWTRERVERQYAMDANLAGEDLQGLDLSGMVLEGVLLAGANLTGTRLAETVLAGADLTGARLERADLTAADLSDAVLDGAALQEATLTKARAADASLVGANLSDAVLVEGQFDRADFTEAVLDRAGAHAASFIDAEFGQVHAVDAMFASAIMTGLRAADALDLSRANLTQIDAVESIWSGATLSEAIFAWARLDGADFEGANLRGADFYAAHLREARFGGADLLDGRLAAADALEASFERADLARSDLRGGNFYAAEFLDARFWETLTEGANLQMTKYE